MIWLRRTKIIFFCRSVEDADEKRLKLILFFSKNIHNKWVNIYLLSKKWIKASTETVNSFCPQNVANVYIFFSKYLILIDMIYLQFLSRYNIYFAGFVFCELLNFLMVVLLIGLTHRFLHFNFVAYGFEVTGISVIFGILTTILFCRSGNTICCQRRSKECQEWKTQCAMLFLELVKLN